MIDTDKHDWDNQPLAHEVPYWMRHMYDNALMIIARKEAEVKELRRQIKVAQGVFEHLYDDELEDASWIRWFCNMEDEEECLKE